MSKLNHSEMTKEQFLETVCSEIKCKKARKPLLNELLSHIDDQKNAYFYNGDDEVTAERKAVAEMGDPVDVGKQLDRIHKPRFDFGIFIPVLLLFATGLCICPFIWDFYPQFFKEAVIYFLLPAFVPGVIVFSLAYFLDYRILFKKAVWVLSAAVAVNIASITAMTASAGNIRLYEIAQAFCIYIPILFILAFAMFIHYVKHLSYRGIWLCLAVYFAFIIPRIIVQAYTTMNFVTISCLIFMTAALVKNTFNVNRIKACCIVYIPMSVMTGITVPSILRLTPSNIADMAAQYSENTDVQWLNEFYGIAQSIISQSKIFGGIDIVPADNFEQIRRFGLTNVFGKLGYVAGFTVIAIFAVLIIKMFRNCFIQNTEKGFWLSLSAAAILSYQIITAIITDLGIYYIGEWIPLLSITGERFVISMALIGFIMSAYRNNNIIWEIKDTEKPFAFLRRGMAFEEKKLR